jgi:hypothetical protein
MRQRITLAPPAGDTQTAWVALPYSNSYGNAQTLVSSMNGGAGAGPVLAVSRVDRTMQQKQTYAFQGGAWSGNNFALLPGEAVEVKVASAWTWGLVGAGASAPAYGFAYHSNVANLSWIALPPNAVYADAQSLVASMNGGAGSGPITKLARLDPQTSQMESYLYFAGAWRGTNFPIQPGTGVAVLVGQDLPSWTPRLAQP